MSGRIVILFLLLVGTASPQNNREFSQQNLAWRVRLHLALAGGGSCDSSMRVALMGNANFPVAEGFASRDCVVVFYQVPAGAYHAVVDGQSLQSTNVAVELSPSDFSDIQDLEVKVKPIGRVGVTNGLPANSFVSVADLGVPAAAEKEFAKASHLIEKQDWDKAIDRLQKAVTIYPSFAAAYNNLGVVYSRVGNRARGREALQKAISIDDHLVPAYVNLSRISIVANNFAEADTLLGKATELAPPDATTLVLLAYVEAREEHLDQTIATSRQAHAMTQGQHAFVHLAAAHAFEQKRMIAESVAELQMYLSEDPTSPQAGEVRKAIATLQASHAVAGGKPE